MGTIKAIATEAREILQANGNTACIEFLRDKGIPLRFALRYLEQFNAELSAERLATNKVYQL